MDSNWNELQQHYKMIHIYELYNDGVHNKRKKLFSSTSCFLLLLLLLLLFQSC